jgi:acetylornithine deacetylase/succinyl-diaminopimelate desuccinylase-like protein
MTPSSLQKEYLDANFDQFVEQLQEFLAIPSISTLPENQTDVSRAAEWLHEKITAVGFPTAKIVATAGHPLVYGEWQVDPTLPTLLFYGHFDVQPVDPLEEWLIPPFQPTIKEGNIYCRGASDDKSQIVLVLAALEAWVKTTGHPPVNIKILLEGEEEAGGASIADFVKKNPVQLQADAVLICDTPMINPDQPCIIKGLRGIVYTEVIISGSARDLHSGAYGGVAPNPLHALSILISRLKGEDGTIQIPELMAGIIAPSPEEKQFCEKDPLGVAHNLCNEMGLEHTVGESGYSPLERLGLRPTLELHGIRGGFTGQGAKTVIPATAAAKISLRLPPNFDPDEVFTWFEKAVIRKMPKGFQTQVINLHSGRGVYVDPENSYIQAASSALNSAYGAEPVCMRHGGSIPIAALFDEVLQAPVILMGFGLPDDSIHAPNEKFSLRQLRKGMETVVEFLARIA